MVSRLRNEKLVKPPFEPQLEVLQGVAPWSVCGIVGRVGDAGEKHSRVPKGR
jgi:hypothetical protein